MEYRTLGSSGLQVSVVGLGCNNFGRRCDQAATTAVVEKALDSGVTLKYVGEKPTAEGADAWVLDLTFVEVGYTPQNRYHVYVGKESGLVEQWDFYPEAANEEPSFALPWKGWQTFGGIKLATNHGRDRDWSIAVHDTLPPSVFNDPGPVQP